MRNKRRLTQASQRVYNTLRDAVANHQLTLYENLFQRNFFPHAHVDIAHTVSADVSSKGVRLLQDDNAGRNNVEEQDYVESSSTPTSGNYVNPAFSYKVKSPAEILAKANHSPLARRMLTLLQQQPHPMAEYGLYN